MFSTCRIHQAALKLDFGAIKTLREVYDNLKPKIDFFSFAGHYGYYGCFVDKFFFVFQTRFVLVLKYINNGSSEKQLCLVIFQHEI